MAFAIWTLIAGSADAKDCLVNRNGNWSSNSTWTSCSGSRPGTADRADFGATGYTVTLTGNTSVGNIAGTVAADVINLGNRTLTLRGYARGVDQVFAGALVGSGGNLTLNMAGNSLTLTGTNTYAGTTTITAGTLTLGTGGSISDSAAIVNKGVFAVNSTSAVTIGQVISNSGAFVQSGSGTTQLTGANTYTGTTTISAGTLALGTGGSINNSSAIANDGTLQINSANTLTLSQGISGAGAVQQTGTGTTTLSGSNSYTGGTVINDGTLRIGAASNLGGGPIAMGGGTLETTNSSALTLNPAIDLAPATTSTLIAGSGGVTVAGIISGSGGLAVDGGTVTLNAANLYTGGTTVTSGTMQLGNASTLASNGALTVNGGSFVLNGHDQTVGNLAGSGGTIALGANRLTAGAAVDTSTASLVTGTGVLVKQGIGTLTLSNGANSYSGGTSITAGELRLTASGAAGSGAIAVAAGAGLVGSNITLANTIVNDGTISGDGMLTLSGLVSGSGSYDGVVSFGGGLAPDASVALIQGSTINFLASNTYSVLIGGVVPQSNYTQLNAGSLQLGGILDVNWTGGFSGAVGNVFTLFTADNITGNFADFTLPVLATGLGWRSQIVTAGLQRQFNLMVVRVTEPWSGAVLLAGITGLLVMRRRKAEPGVPHHPA